VLAESPAGSFDVEHDGVVQELVDDRRGDDGVSNSAPQSARPRLMVTMVAEPFSLLGGFDDLEERVARHGRAWRACGYRVDAMALGTGERLTR
jgi:hypothetical protein